MAQEV